ncbi:MAG: hypothetical protein GTO51_09710 [Candidatus Latescibacteria bacterium]|nr:hypothetical protein [Candidatus Latescibacterota bacterium]NIM22205.1 hypothetical protein [Candidatus Latescibacterota bacterium]NIM66244.1 hypothetical protein [Candidatus Latescibacterota bacterium]NIO02321.1 hypothetical protein [Candidatus Latescibacterota bacterium]NIO29852.1 hypothetical protein [Candidatus Latescibacterota bacterium]
MTAGIYGQKYDNNGNPLGTKFQIDALGDSLHSGPAIAMGAEGDFVAVWAARAHGAGHKEIKARMFASTGAPASPESQVNTSEGGEQMDPAVAMSQSGDFVVFGSRTLPARTIGKYLDNVSIPTAAGSWMNFKQTVTQMDINSIPPLRRLIHLYS